MKSGLSRVAAFALALVISTIVPAVAAVPDRTQDNTHITNGPIAEYLADNAVEIAWSTRGSTQMALRYGTDPDHMEQVVEAAQRGRGKTHHARIQGLRPDTKYFFQVVSPDHQPADEIGVFKTLAPGSAPVTRKVIVP